MKNDNEKKLKGEDDILKLNDQEMNTLEYEQAIIIDKRDFIQYYTSLIRKHQLILFTFFSSNDYNLITVKYSLFLLSFSLYLVINGFFFNDATMHKIYEKENGSYNFIYQIPQILYSCAVSLPINILLKRLSLSQLSILKLKKEEKIDSAMERGKNLKNSLYIKVLVFFILSFILMSFFWYYISSFCAVYKNTQKILIEDTLISFGLSMIYPFAINLLPGIFRIYALKAPNKDKKCLYKFSVVLSLI